MQQINRERFFEKLKLTLTEGCVIYTVLITALYVIGYVFDRGGEWIPRFRMMWVVLGVSFVIAAAERILDGGETGPVRIILNFAACLAGYLVIFVVGGGYINNGAAVLISLFIFIILYVAANVIRFAAAGKLRRRRSEEEDYDPAFKG